VPRIFPFVGLTFDRTAGPLERLTAPPYDVISGSRRGAVADASPHNIVHVDLAEGHDDPAAPDSRYARAAELMRAWRRESVLRASDEPGYYAYEMRFRLGDEDRRISGLMCAMELEPWGGGVLPHEETMPGPVEDRLRLLRATRTHLSPVYGTIAGPCDPLANLLDGVARRSASSVVTDDEGVEHRMWPIDAAVDVASWVADEPLLIADGHHRYTTALAYRDERRGEDGAGPWDRILTLLVDAGTQTVPVLAYHRLQVGGEPVLGRRRVADLDAVLDVIDDAAGRYGTATRNADGAVEYGVDEVRGGPPTVRSLHREVLDGRSSGDALRFTHDALEADAAVRRGEALAAYFVPATTPERIRNVVEHGDRLPRKSTFFWPKPRTGMVLMPLDAPHEATADPPHDQAAEAAHDSSAADRRRDDEATAPR
jgi:uncharacterized protein (DUF1015 family)